MPNLKIFTAVLLGTSLLGAQAQESISNASYDVSRELYKEFNPAFAAAWKAKTGKTLEIIQTHNGSSKQAQAVINGLEADVVTLNQVSDIQALVKEKLVAEDWASKFPDGSSPYQSITTFVVRKGNPKNIKDWNDLIRPDVKIALVNPKTSGNGRYTFLGAYTYALKANGGDAAKAKEFISKFYKNVPVLDTGGRAATQTFAQRNIGDVLITFEAEVAQIRQEFGVDAFESVTPSITVSSDFPVAIVEKVVDKRGTREIAKAYLDYLFTPEGQEIVAKSHYRPRNAEILAKYSAEFAKTELVDPAKEYGGWSKISQEFFADGGIFDQIYTGGL